MVAYIMPKAVFVIIIFIIAMAWVLLTKDSKEPTVKGQAVLKKPVFDLTKLNITLES